MCFSPDDKQVLTVSGDKTAKVFDVQSGNLIQWVMFLLVLDCNSW